ncbi:selenoneine biosynthesis selenosugar synthase SenB [Massilia sp. CMS3.1]|uniref:selenoneine biosynthesis selenosugar synthase SenB n=1 Tax=Massilia sp. CMS3.1 TaxID=3373083 RepID=UPI003EE5061A
MDRKHLLIVSPAAARDNNGNWQTASRWARFLRGRHRVEISHGWTAADPVPDLLIALHARRSADALAAFHAAHPDRPTVLVLTGTDLYRDIETSANAGASLESASALVVLQEAGLARLAPHLQSKTHVIYQSSPALRPVPLLPASRYIDVCMIGHLRAEKDPLTFMRAAALVTHPRVRLLHIGAALDPAWLEAARSTEAANPRYRWLGPMPHAQTRQRLKRCRAMVIASTMEGGANVIIEAVTSSVPVLASSIEGNIGMLGKDYAGYFPLGDAAALAQLIERCAHDQAFDSQLRRQCAERAPRFAPAAEQAALADLVDNLLRPATRTA